MQNLIKLVVVEFHALEHIGCDLEAAGSRKRTSGRSASKHNSGILVLISPRQPQEHLRME